MVDLTRMLAECRTEEERQAVLAWERESKEAIAAERERERLVRRSRSTRRWTLGLGLFVWVWLGPVFVFGVVTADPLAAVLSGLALGGATWLLIAVDRRHRIAPMGAGTDHEPRVRTVTFDDFNETRGVVSATVGIFAGLAVGGATQSWLAGVAVALLLYVGLVVVIARTRAGDDRAARIARASNTGR